MQTGFSPAQLGDPDIREADAILRKCVHCGFCLPVCPTYKLLGDERDSPRGRIYLIKGMLESDAPPSAAVTTHIDRCLSCLACTVACPSGVDYHHYIDYARHRVAASAHRGASARLMRAVLPRVLPHRRRFAALLALARLARPVLGLLGARFAPLAALIPPPPGPASAAGPGVHQSQGPRRKRVALLEGCVQPVLRPAINDATVRLLTRMGCEVVVARNVGCCGAVTLHMGAREAARASARANVAAWTEEIEARGLDAIVVNAAGCGTMVKDYGHLLAGDAGLAEAAQRIAGLARDLSELVAELGGVPKAAAALPEIAYQDACSLANGQGVRDAPRALLAGAGFGVREIADGGLCCGSAGTYNLLQPEIASRLRARKVAAVAKLDVAALCTANIGCLTQLAPALEVPVLHLAELLDWAGGGPHPAGL